jgi:hypothetical protein
MGAILGPGLHVMVSGTDDLVGRFNARLQNKVLVQSEEAFFAGDKKHAGRLKTLITAPTITIELKNKDAFTIANMTHLLTTSNETWVANAGLGERRHALFVVSGEYADNLEYFGALHREMFVTGNYGDKSPGVGCARLLHHLLHEVDVDWNLIARPVKTDALRDQQILSLDPEHRWLFDLLSIGELPGDLSGEGAATCDEVFVHFEKHITKTWTRSQNASYAVGRLLAGFGVTKDRRGPPRTPGARGTRRYVFPPLSEIRAKFAQQLATAPDWDMGEEWHAADPVIGALFAGSKHGA